MRLLLIIIGCWGLWSAVPAAAQIPSPDTPLSSADVKYWLETEIEVVTLQNDYKANADRYDDVIAAFFAEAEELMIARGYASRAAYDAVSERIYGAVTTMEDQADLDEDRALRAAGPGEAEQDAEAVAMMEEMIAEIEANPYFSPEQKKEMIAGIRAEVGNMVEMDMTAMEDEVDAQQQAGIDLYKKDWPGVRPWLAEIEHLTDWAAGNRADPPVIE